MIVALSCVSEWTPPSRRFLDQPIELKVKSNQLAKNVLMCYQQPDLLRRELKLGEDLWMGLLDDFLQSDAFSEPHGAKDLAENLTHLKEIYRDRLTDVLCSGGTANPTPGT